MLSSLGSRYILVDASQKDHVRSADRETGDAKHAIEASALKARRNFAGNRARTRRPATLHSVVTPSPPNHLVGRVALKSLVDVPSRKMGVTDADVMKLEQYSKFIRQRHDESIPEALDGNQRSQLKSIRASLANHGSCMCCRMLETATAEIELGKLEVESLRAEVDQVRIEVKIAQIEVLKSKQKESSIVSELESVKYSSVQTAIRVRIVLRSSLLFRSHSWFRKHL